MTRIRYITWNVSGFRSPLGAERASWRTTLERVRALSPNVVAFQELEFIVEADSLAELSAEMVACLQLPYFYGLPLSASHLSPSARLGLGLLCDSPLVGIRSRVLPNPHLGGGGSLLPQLSHDKGVMLAEIQDDTPPMTVGSLHLLPFHRFGKDPKSRQYQPIWRDLGTYLDDEIARPGIIGGDFNTADRSLILDRVGGDKQSLATGRITQPSLGYSFDDVLLLGVMKCVAVQIIETPSDHSLLYCEVEVS